MPLLWLASFLVGGAVMVVELVGARLLAPTFGTSVVPWTAVITAVLAGVALGNGWGGSRSRKGPRELGPLLLISAISVLLPLLRGDLPDLLLSRLGMAGGALAVAVLLFFPAAFLLGAAGPLLVRAATRELGEVGRRSGSLNGANALGAIAGTLATGFLLIPLAPLSHLLLGVAGTLAAAGAVVGWGLPRAPLPGGEG